MNIKQLKVVVISLSLFLAYTAWGQQPIERAQIRPHDQDEIQTQANQMLAKNELDKAIALFDETLKKYKPDWILIDFVVQNKYRLYKQAGQYDEAEKALYSMRTLYTEPTVGLRKTPANLVIETSISNKLIRLYRESKQYDKAIKMTEHWMGVYKEKIEKSYYESEAEKALDLLQSGPACLAEIYQEWGKYDLARKYYQAHIDYLNSDSTKWSILRKLDGNYRLAWEEINPKIIFPLEIAKCYEKEGDFTKALYYAEQVKKTIDDPGLKKKYEQFSSEKRRIEKLRDRDLIPLISRCQEKIKN